MTFQTTLEIRTQGSGSHELTNDLRRVVEESGIERGLCNVFIRHTSASLMICENADTDVRRDLETFMSRLVPDGDAMFEQTTEGPDDMPAHVRSVLTQTSITVPVTSGACAFGTWQGLYLWEHRDRGHRREILITVYGD